MKWNDFLNKELIGTGSFGKVYKIDYQNGKIAALKKINKQFHKFRLQFKSAFEVASKIKDPNLLQVYSWLSDDEVSWIMEFVTGQSISEMKYNDQVGFDPILKAIIQVCNGLISLHSKNIIHRDIKPSNILLDKNHLVKITDFDFMKIRNLESQFTEFIGTPAYSSPESFITSYELDIRSDLYSLGVVLYELLTGKLPFSGKNSKEIGDKHRLKPLLLPSKLNPKIPAGIERIVVELLEKNPKDRYQHAHAVAKDLYKQLKNKKNVLVKDDIPYLLQPRFVNREKSFGILSSLLDEIQSKQSKIVLILGESGIGKSKLIQHFYQYMQLTDTEYYYSICKTLEYAFEPLASIIQDLMANKPDTQKIRYFGKFGWDLVNVGLLPEQDWMQTIKKPPELSGKDAEIRLFGAITDLIKQVTHKPTVICLDDLQWANAVVLRWLVYAERNLRDFPVLIIGLHRTEQLAEDSEIFKVENLTQIPIKNLKQKDIKAMIKSMLGVKRASNELQEFIKKIISHSHGNPLFIREILYFLQDKGEITIKNNKWLVTADLNLSELPSDVVKVIQERLKVLNISSRITLQTAAIIGKRFSFEMLQDISGRDETELISDLNNCREAALIEEKGSNYSFIHDKVREVLDTELKENYPSTWSELHLKTGEYLEKKFSSNYESVLDDIADHFYYAENSEKSIKYNELAGNRAKKNYLNNNALTFFEHAIFNIEIQLRDINKKQPQYKELVNKHINILHKKGDILKLMGSWQDAMRIYENTLELSTKLGDKKNVIDALNQIGWQFSLVGKYEKATEFYNNAIKISEEIGDKIGMFTAIGSIGTIYYYQSDYNRALDCFTKELNNSIEMGEKRGISRALFNIGSAYLGKHEYEKAIEYYRKKLEICIELGDKKDISGVFSNIGSVYRHQRKYSQALEYYKKALKICKEIGDKSGISYVYGNMAYVHTDRFEFEKGLVNLKKLLYISKELGDIRGISGALGGMESIYIYQLKYDEAMKCCKENLKIKEKLGNEKEISKTIENIGIIYGAQGNFNKSIMFFKRSLKIREKLKDERGLTHTYHNLGEVYCDLGNYSKAMVYFNKQLKISKQFNDKIGIVIGINSKGIIYYLLGNNKRAMEFLNESILLSRELKSKYYLCSFLYDKANLLDKLNKNDAKFVNNEALNIALEINRSDVVFNCKILSLKIYFKTIEKQELKIKNCIQPLEEMLKEEKQEENIATLHYELAKMNHELKRKEIAEKQKEIAIDLYKKLYKKTPKYEFKKNIEELKSLKLN